MWVFGCLCADTIIPPAALKDSTSPVTGGNRPCQTGRAEALSIREE